METATLWTCQIVNGNSKFSESIAIDLHQNQYHTSSLKIHHIICTVIDISMPNTKSRNSTFNNKNLPYTFSKKKPSKIFISKEKGNPGNSFTPKTPNEPQRRPSRIKKSRTEALGSKKKCISIILPPRISPVAV